MRQNALCKKYILYRKVVISETSYRDKHETLNYISDYLLVAWSPLIVWVVNIQFLAANTIYLFICFRFFYLWDINRQISPFEKKLAD